MKEEHGKVEEGKEEPKDHGTGEDGPKVSEEYQTKVHSLAKEAHNHEMVDYAHNHFSKRKSELHEAERKEKEKKMPHHGKSPETYSSEDMPVD